MRPMQIEPRSRRWAWLAVALVVVFGFAGCAGEAASEVPLAEDGTADPILVEGRGLWQDICSRCHGGAGGGGAGPALRGPWTADRQPDLADMVATITQGRAAMPRFGESLSDDEIAAVVRYVREVL